MEQNIRGLGNTQSSSMRQQGWSTRVRTSGNKKKIKKKLKYNPREISALLLNANRSQAALSVLIMARNRLADLKSKSVTGDYDKTAIMRAVVHAERMVLCARTKVSNLKEEEMEKLQNDKAEDSLSEIRVRQKKLFRKQQIKLKKQQLELKKKCRKHRNEERAKINEADRAYVREGDERDFNSSLMNVSEKEILSEIKRLKQQEQQEDKDRGSTENESAADNSGAVVDVAVSDELDTAVSADSVSVDISV